MAPMGQFELPTVRVVNSTEPSVRFRGERGRFAMGSGQPMYRRANRTDLTLEAADKYARRR